MQLNSVYLVFTLIEQAGYSMSQIIGYLKKNSLKDLRNT